MRYATVQFSDDGTTTDVRPYLEWLDAHADELPPGARAFALDVGQRDLTVEEDTAACALALDMLSEYLAERGQIAE